MQRLPGKQHPVFKQIIMHERTSQDGFRVLYAMLGTCHPNLIKRRAMSSPSMTTTPNLLGFVRLYLNFLEYERINGRQYKDSEQFKFMTNEMSKDGRYEKALGILQGKIDLYESMLEHHNTTPFPSQLTLNTLPYTVINLYTEEERRSGRTHAFQF